MSGPVDGGDRRCYTNGHDLTSCRVDPACREPLRLRRDASDRCARLAKASAGKQTSGAAAAVQLKREQILEQQLKPLAKPASVPAGQKLYDVLCAMCHRFGSIGQDVGPDLTTVTSRFGRKELLESILWPSRTISDQYESELFETVNGKVHHGLLVRETAAALQIRTVDSPKPIVLAIADIQSRRKSPQSFMPEGLIDGLTPVGHRQSARVHVRGPAKVEHRPRDSPQVSRLVRRASAFRIAQRATLPTRRLVPESANLIGCRKIRRFE